MPIDKGDIYHITLLDSGIYTIYHGAACCSGISFLYTTALIAAVVYHFYIQWRQITPPRQSDMKCKKSIYNIFF